MMRLRKLNIIVHRDLGYFFAGTAIIYAISGLAVNHVGDWDPNFVIQRQPVTVASSVQQSEINKDWVMDVLAPLKEEKHYRSHDFPSPTKLKIYLDDGSVFINLASGEGEYEVVKRRPILYQFNRLHLSPKRAWLVFSDVFAVALIVITVTGLFVLKGKNGIRGRGIILVTAGLVMPVLFLFLV